jgi:hypothetical protein
MLYIRWRIQVAPDDHLLWIWNWAEAGMPAEKPLDSLDQQLRRHQPGGGGKGIG